MKIRLQELRLCSQTDISWAFLEQKGNFWQNWSGHDPQAWPDLTAVSRIRTIGTVKPYISWSPFTCQPWHGVLWKFKAHAVAAHILELHYIQKSRPVLSIRVSMIYIWLQHGKLEMISFHVLKFTPQCGPCAHYQLAWTGDVMLPIESELFPKQCWLVWPYT